MLLQTKHFAKHRRNQSTKSGKLRACTHLSISGVPIDIRVTPLGERLASKRAASIDLLAGGHAANAGPVFLANHLECGALGVQATGEIAALAHRLLQERGLVPYLIERSGVREALSVATPNGKPGAFHLDVQRLEPLTVSEFSAFVKRVAQGPNSVFMGPMPRNPESLTLHIDVCRFAARRAWMVHPSLLREPGLFQEIGQLYHYVQMNFAEAGMLDPTIRELEQLACRVRYLLGEQVDFAITNGAQAGLLWCDRRWLQIRPRRLKGIEADVGAGDVFGAAICLARWYFHASPEGALRYACQAAEALLTGEPIPAYAP